jgi:hypothetical protein
METPMRVEDLHHEELLELDPEGGVIRFAGQRTLVFDATAMGLPREYLVESLGPTPDRHASSKKREQPVEEVVLTGFCCAEAVRVRRGRGSPIEGGKMARGRRPKQSAENSGWSRNRFRGHPGAPSIEG